MTNENRSQCTYDGIELLSHVPSVLAFDKMILFTGLVLGRSRLISQRTPEQATRLWACAADSQSCLITRAYRDCARRRHTFPSAPPKDLQRTFNGIPISELGS